MYISSSTSTSTSTPQPSPANHSRPTQNNTSSAARPRADQANAPFRHRCLTHPLHTTHLQSLLSLPTQLIPPPTQIPPPLLLNRPYHFTTTESQPDKWRLSPSVLSLASRQLPVALQVRGPGQPAVLRCAP
ncbi:hypothetical protein L207DRAFT_510192 [Hyaloscypha variabilis F]|uniref:Uncharacterized protein n=1 Tax=Hyaloscypha variabilis (strain UAMH 11265 / GT02V1 / F) TaxID=1149755 RepID=A0A2J6RYU7_HYAVF|nr:hypothetical protein L207DRAFT_510192 [Hyaloscypha variabilis F]